MPGHPANWSYLGHLTPDAAVHDRPRAHHRRVVDDQRRLLRSCSPRGLRHGGRMPQDPTGATSACSPSCATSSAISTSAPGRSTATRGRCPYDGRRRRTRRRAAFHAAALELGFARRARQERTGRPRRRAGAENVVDGVRINTAIAYLEPRARPAEPRRASADAARAGRVRRPRAVGVEVDEQGPGVPARRVIDADEVVLCAGGIGTPHLLLVSGVGPAAQLQAHGVPVVHDAAGVGRAFSDHPELSVGWRARRDVVDPRAPETFTTALNFACRTGAATRRATSRSWCASRR